MHGFAAREAAPGRSEPRPLIMVSTATLKIGSTMAATMAVATLVFPSVVSFTTSAQAANSSVTERRIAAREQRLTDVQRRQLQISARKTAAANAGALTRKQILASDADRLARIGRHIMIGYHDIREVKALVEARAISGIFITDHNARRRTVAAIRAEIDMLQAIRAKQGLPPLIVAADQEGGAVSRLSPPLKRQPSLGEIISKAKSEAERTTAIKAYAETQGRQLKSIGVNLNFAPVVDLKFQPNNRADGQTLLRLRAISEDPKIVAEVAGQYCETLAAFDIMCTLKHFPGLGRVKIDTHRTTAELATERSELESKDWVPFQKLMNRPYTMTMIGHIRLNALGAKTPASFSRTIIHDLIRRDWGYAGILITDDFSMGAVTRSPDGVGGASVKALQAGVDIVLVSYIERHFNSVMTALLAADRAGKLDPKLSAASSNRIEDRMRNATTHHAPEPAATEPSIPR